MSEVTRKLAEQVLDQIRARNPDETRQLGDVDQPFLADHNHECLSPGAWSIAWESGPYEWAIRFCSGGLDEDAYQALVAAGTNPETALALAREQPAGEGLPVFLEPINSYTIGIYPQDV